MSRYTRTDTASKRACPNGVGTFIGWDTLDGVSEEATLVEGLGLAMTADDVAVFSTMASGEERTVGDATYFRQF